MKTVSSEGAAPKIRPFERLFSRAHQRPGEDHLPVSFEGRGCWWDDPGAIPLAAARGFNIRAVGESRFQAEISSIVGGRCEAGHNCQMPAELVLAGNDRELRAVGIRINSRPVGFLPQEAAAAVRPLIVAAGGRKAITCKAKIVGGWDRGNSDWGYFGVKLSLALPPKIDARVGRP